MCARLMYVDVFFFWGGGGGWWVGIGLGGWTGSPSLRNCRCKRRFRIGCGLFQSTVCGEIFGEFLRLRIEGGKCPMRTFFQDIR